jgi:hypothetical protein
MSTNLKISQMTEAESLTGSELIPIIQDGVNKITDPNLVVTSVLSAENTMDITIVGTVTSTELVTDQIRTSSDETPVISSNGNLNFAVAGRIDIESGSLTLGRFNNSERDSIPAVNGTIIYNTSDNTIQVYAAGSWLTISVPQNNTVSSTSTEELTPNIDAATQYNITALASNLSILAPTGTPRDGQKLIIRLKDSGGVNRNITWNSAYRSIGISLPTVTVTTKVTYVGFIYNQAESVWDAVAVKTQV